MQNGSKNVTSTNPKDVFGRMKPDVTLIAPVALIVEALAMANGAKKYGPFNWREKTVAARVYTAACMRHLLAWNDGEEMAVDSGIHHLGHARACLGILLDAQANGTLVDDRPMKGRASEMIERFTLNTRTQPYQADSDERALMGMTVRTQAEMNPMVHAPLTVFESRAQIFNIPVTGLEEAKDGEVVAMDSWSNQDTALLLTERKRKVYIAGPMRGYDKFNFPAFDAARDLAISKGFAPVNPADMDRDSGFSETSVPASSDFSPDINREFARRDCEALLSFKGEHGDAIAMLPNWTRSTGAASEFFLARWLGLKVLDATTMEPFTPGAAYESQLSMLSVNARKYLETM